MNTLRLGFIILVSVLFLGVVSIGGSQAKDKSKAPPTKPPGVAADTKGVKKGTKLKGESKPEKKEETEQKVEPIKLR